MAGQTPTLHEHEGPHPNYWFVGIVLSVLTVLELAVTSNYATRLLNLPDIATNTALLFFAVAKALFVVGYYMHLKFDSRVYSTLFVTGILFALLLATTFMLLF